MLCKELDEYAMKQKISSADLEMIWKLSDTVKNLDKIEMLEEDGGHSYDDDMRYSERRGRGRNARRDSMGRYSSDNGASYDEYPEERMDRRYSRDDAKEHLKTKLGEMMEDANLKDRETLKECMRMLNF